jgi:hypothetical protein
MPSTLPITIGTQLPVVIQPGETNLWAIKNLDELEGLRDSWCAMQSNPNSDIDFYSDVVHSWRDRCRPHVLVISRNGRLDALLVGRAETARIECKLGYKTLFHIRARKLTFIYAGAMGEISPHYCELFLDAIRDTLKRLEADLAEFNFVRTDSALCQSLSTVKDLRLTTSVVQAHRSTEIGHTAQDTFRKLSSKRRRNLRNKKIQQDFAGQIKLRCFRELDGIAEMFADVETIAGKTYHRQLAVGFDGSQELIHRLTREAARGRLRAYLLYLNDQPAAFWIATAYKGTLFSDFMGYDPAFKTYSPGMFLITSTLESLSTDEIDCNIRKVDWGLGDAQYKQVLGDTEWHEVNIRIFGASTRSRMIEAITVPVAKFEAWLKRALADSKLLQQVKTGWRRRLVEKKSSTRPTE